MLLLCICVLNYAVCFASAGVKNECTAEPSPWENCRHKQEERAMHVVLVTRFKNGMHYVQRMLFQCVRTLHARENKWRMYTGRQHRQ